MLFDSFWKRFVAFGLAFALGLFAAAFLLGVNFSHSNQPKLESEKKIALPADEGRGYCVSDGKYHGFKEPLKKSKTPPSKEEGVKIISKPRAVYTDAGRANQTQGKVVLRVTFKADREIGSVSVISGLPDGLTERAIEAVKGIKFEPAKRDGVPYTVSKPVEYTFTIY